VCLLFCSVKNESRRGKNTVCVMIEDNEDKCDDDDDDDDDDESFICSLFKTVQTF